MTSVVMDKLKSQLSFLDQLIEEAQIIWKVDESVAACLNLFKTLDFGESDKISCNIIELYRKKFIDFRKMYAIVMHMFKKIRAVENVFRLKYELLTDNFKIIDKMNKSIERLKDVKKSVTDLRENYDELKGDLTIDYCKKIFLANCNLLKELKEKKLILKHDVYDTYTKIMKYIEKVINETYIQQDDIVLVLYELNKKNKWIERYIDQIIEILKTECITTPDLFKKFLIQDELFGEKDEDLIKLVVTLDEFCDTDQVKSDENDKLVADLFDEWFGKTLDAHFLDSIDSCREYLSSEGVKTFLQLKTYWREIDELDITVPLKIVNVLDKKCVANLDFIFDKVIIKNKFNKSTDAIKILKKMKDHLEIQKLHKFKEIRDFWEDSKFPFEIPFGINEAFKEELSID